MRQTGLELITLLPSLLCCHLLEGAAWRQPQFENYLNQKDDLPLDQTDAMEIQNSYQLERGEYHPYSWLESPSEHSQDMTRLRRMAGVLPNLDAKANRGRVLYEIMILLKKAYQKAAIECILKGPYPCENPLLTQSGMNNKGLAHHPLAEDYAKARALERLVAHENMANEKATGLNKRGRMLSVDQSLHSLDRGDHESSTGDRLESSLSKLNVLG